MQPQAMTVTSRPARSSLARPRWNGRPGSVTGGSSTRPPRRTYTGPSASNAALAAIVAQMGFIDEALLDRFYGLDSPIGMHDRGGLAHGTLVTSL